MDLIPGIGGDRSEYHIWFQSGTNLVEKNEESIISGSCLSIPIDFKRNKSLSSWFTFAVSHSTLTEADVPTPLWRYSIICYHDPWQDIITRDIRIGIIRGDTNWWVQIRIVHQFVVWIAPDKWRLEVDKWKNGRSYIFIQPFLGHNLPIFGLKNAWLRTKPDFHHGISSIAFNLKKIIEIWF